MALSLLPAFLAARRPRAVLATWGYPDGFAAVLLGRLAGLPVTIKVHGSDVESLDEGGLGPALARWGLRRADGVVSVSRYLRERLVAHGIDPARVAVVHNGVDAQGFGLRDRAEARRELGLAEAGRLVLYVGNLKADKGLPELIDERVVAACREAGAALAIAGDGPYRGALEKAVRERGLGETVRLLGRLPPARIAAWMNAADCLCLPSHHEGIPNVILEALSCGVPVVATRVGGIPEVLSEAGGRLVSPRDPASLAEGLRDVLGRPWDRGAVRAACPAGDWERSAKSLLDAIDGKAD
jgi:glycosyltransferase involved in cell wall biosynthesis